jgi:transcriptional regulator with XRE-family HTH domain
MSDNQAINAQTGRKLRALRLRAHFSMRELAERAGVAVSYVSNVEAGLVSATLATLRKLLMALGTDLGPFFATDPSVPSGSVFRRHQMQTTSDTGRSYTFILPVRPDIRLNLMDEEMFAGEQPEFETLASDLAGYVLSGELLLEFEGEQPQILQAGDAFYAPANQPVRGRCSSGKSVRLVTVSMQQSHPRRRNRSNAEKEPTQTTGQKSKTQVKPKTKSMT